MYVLKETATRLLKPHYYDNILKKIVGVINYNEYNEMFNYFIAA